jgi:hypothetical protein
MNWRRASSRVDRPDRPPPTDALTVGPGRQCGFICLGCCFTVRQEVDSSGTVCCCRRQVVVVKSARDYIAKESLPAVRLQVPVPWQV